MRCRSVERTLIRQGAGDMMNFRIAPTVGSFDSEEVDEMPSRSGLLPLWNFQFWLGRGFVIACCRFAGFLGQSNRFKSYASLHSRATAGSAGSPSPYPQSWGGYPTILLAMGLRLRSCLPSADALGFLRSSPSSTFESQYSPPAQRLTETLELVRFAQTGQVRHTRTAP